MYAYLNKVTVEDGRPHMLLPVKPVVTVSLMKQFLNQRDDVTFKCTGKNVFLPKSTRVCKPCAKARNMKIFITYRLHKANMLDA